MKLKVAKNPSKSDEIFIEEHPLRTENRDGWQT